MSKNKRRDKAQLKGGIIVKRVIALILTLVICAVVFVGCGTNSDVSKTRFVMIDDSISIDKSTTSYDAHLLADRETGVVYFYMNGYSKASMTVLLNTDGTPMIYDFKSDKIIKQE